MTSGPDDDPQPEHPATDPDAADGAETSDSEATASETTGSETTHSEMNGAQGHAEHPDPHREESDADWERDSGYRRTDEPMTTGLPNRLEAWRRRSATGAILTGFARGLQQVFEKEPERPSIIQTTSGDPPTDLPVEAEVELGRPRQSTVNIRPWLLPTKDPADESAEADETAEAAKIGDSGAETSNEDS